MLWSGEVSDRSVCFDRFTSGRTRTGGGVGWWGFTPESHYDIWSCQFKLALTGKDWHGSRVTGRTQQRWGRFRPSCPLIAMATAQCNYRCCWHFWLMCCHWWMTAVTGVARRRQTVRRDDIITVRPVFRLQEWRCVCVNVCVGVSVYHL